MKINKLLSGLYHVEYIREYNGMPKGTSGFAIKANVDMAHANCDVVLFLKPGGDWYDFIPENTAGTNLEYTGSDNDKVSSGVKHIIMRWLREGQYTLLGNKKVKLIL